MDRWTLNFKGSTSFLWSWSLMTPFLLRLFFWNWKLVSLWLIWYFITFLSLETLILSLLIWLSYIEKAEIGLWNFSSAKFKFFWPISFATLFLRKTAEQAITSASDTLLKRPLNKLFEVFDFCFFPLSKNKNWFLMTRTLFWFSGAKASFVILSFESEAIGETRTVFPFFKKSEKLKPWYCYWKNWNNVSNSIPFFQEWKKIITFLSISCDRVCMSKISVFSAFQT